MHAPRTRTRLRPLSRLRPLAGREAALAVRRAAGAGALAALLAAGLAAAAHAAPFPFEDPARRDLFAGAGAARDGALGAFVNPAAWAAAGGDAAFWWNDVSHEHDALDSWGLSIAGPVGFTMQRFGVAAPEGLLHVRETTLGFAAGDRRHHAGLAWRWAGGDADRFGRESGLVLGGIHRPGRLLSLAARTFVSAESSSRDAAVEIGMRPFGRGAFTLLADYELASTERPDEGSWSAGFALRPFAGLHVGARIVGEAGEDPAFVTQIGLFDGGLGAEVLPRFDDDAKRGATTMIVRARAPVRPLDLRALGAPEPRFVSIDLERRTISLQRDAWFDDRVSWIDLSRRLERLASDDAVAGVVVNLAGTRVRPSILWEMREAFARFTRAGKPVVVHVDRASMMLYYLASGADFVSIDPVGEIRLPGLALQRTYYRALFDKLGLGFEELRWFTYKSALESLSRTDMSEADREQLGRVVDVVYETVRGGVAEGRGISPETFDEVVEQEGFLTAAQANELGFVDRIGRWTELVDSLKAGPASPGAAPAERARWRAEERWGRPPTIALVLAEGECAMDSGIRGRAASKHLERLAERGDVRAVVLRADSPGGDPLPSDLVAAAMAEIREAKKPLVVTQGDVAASGGYLISVESDRILTTPLTLTGSIGVISGWVWDAGLGAKVGMSADGVQRGSHADLFSGIRAPLLGVRLPLRPLSDGERERAREVTMELYDAFVGRVAAARGRGTAEIGAIAQGRVWMGQDAVDRGLGDGIGGLTDALREAKELAGIDADEEVILEEYPPRRLLRFPEPVAQFLGVGAHASEGERANDPAAALFDEDPAWRAVRLTARHNGEPLLLTPPEALPDGWGSAPR